MIPLYVSGAVITRAINLHRIPALLKLILVHALFPTAASSEFSGAVTLQTTHPGMTRGVFSNASGPRSFHRYLLPI